MSNASGLKKIGKGLAGAVAIASGTTAYGSFVYVNPPPDLMTSPGGPNTSVSWDVNGDGTNDFRFLNRYPNTAPGSIGVIWQTSITPLRTNNGVVSYAGAFIRYAYALGYGGFVGPSSPGIAESSPYPTALGSKYSYGSGSAYYGGFANPAVGVAPGHLAFAGFRFQAGDGIHYGWIRLNVNAGIIDFADAAYESTPNQGIGFPLDPPMPEPGTLALLALGAVGVIGTVVKRRR
jgi:hypothetical protein